MMKSIKSQAYIPFITSKGDINVVKKTMSHVDLVRVSADYKYLKEIPDAWKLWIDPCFDGYSTLPPNDSSDWWGSWISQFPNWEQLKTGSTTDKKKIKTLVHAVLDHVAMSNPSVISVPQLIHTKGVDSHSVNRLLAKETGAWKLDRDNNIDLVLPVVLTDSNLYNKKSQRTQKIKYIQSAMNASTARACWVVHSGFDDLSGVSSHEHATFPDMIKFHEELSDTLDEDCTIIAGPYWCLNLVLWVRSFCDIPAISCGKTFKYQPPIPPSRYSQPVNRIALPPYRRLYRCDQELKKWLTNAALKYDKDSRARTDIDKIFANYSTLIGSNPEPSRIQTSIFYISWINGILETHPSGRALYLFQDFTQAVVDGAKISELLPKHTGLSVKARKAGSVAQQFMLQCLER